MLELIFYIFAIAGLYAIVRELRDIKAILKRQSKEADEKES